MAFANARYARVYGSGGLYNPNSGTAYVQRGSGLWSSSVFTVCGWAGYSGGAVYKTLCSYEDVNWIGFENSTLQIRSASGGTNFSGSYSGGNAFFWAITNDGTTGANSYVGYARRLESNSVESVSRTGTSVAKTYFRFFNDSLSSYFGGRIMDARIWDIVLTPEQILEESFSPVPRARIGLRGWYPMQGGNSAAWGRDRTGESHLTTNGSMTTIYPVPGWRRGNVFRPVLAWPVLSMAIDIPSGAVTSASSTPTIVVAQSIAIGAGALTTEGLTPTTAGVVEIAVGAGSAVLSGATPAADVSYVASPGAGALTLDGYAPTAESSRLIDIGSGAATLTGYAADPAISLRFTPDAGALAITGTAPSGDVGAPREIAIPAGVIYTTGYDSRPNQSAAPSPSTASATFSGAAPALGLGYAADAGAATITGAAPSSVLGLAAGAGTLTLSGAAPTMDVSYSFAIQAGGLTAEGLAGAWHVGTTAASGTLTLSANAPHVALGVTIPTVGVGVQGLNPSIAITAAIENRAVTLTGEAPGLDFGMPVGSASAAISGQTPTADATRNQYAYPSAGVLTLTGYAPAFELRSLRPDYDEETWSLVVRSEVWMFQIREETATQ